MTVECESAERETEPDDVDFDALMRRMGVRPLKGDGKRATKASAKQSGSKRALRDRTAGMAHPSASKASATRRADFEAELAALKAEQDAARAEARQAEAERDAARERLRGAEAERDAALERLRRAEAERDAALERLCRAEAERDAAVERLGRAEAAAPARAPGTSAPANRSPEAPPDSEKLEHVLGRRGLFGPDEVNLLFRALGERGLAERVVGRLRVSSSEIEAVTRFLDDSVALVCGDERCPVPSGRAVVRVSRDRCEICEGSDVQRATRGFIEACLGHRITRVVIVGGSARYHAVLRQLLQHPGLDVRLVAGNRRRAAQQARADLDWAQFVILWGGTVLDHSVSDQYDRSAGARVVAIAHRGIIGMLERAADAIGEAASRRGGRER